MPKISNNAEKINTSELYSFFNETKKREANGEKIINLGVGLPYHDTPRNIKDAGIKAIKEGKTKYTPSSGFFGLKEAISNKFKGENLNYSLDQIIISSGAKPLLAAAQWAIINQGDKVIIPSPYYPPFAEVAKQMGGLPVLVDVLEDTAIAETLGCNVSAKAKLLILNSPNNPTGKVYGKKQLDQIAKFAIDNDLWVISDECYLNFVYDNKKHFSIASFEGMKERTILIRSFSKSYSMTGWRVGYAAGHGEVIKKISIYLDNFIGCASSIAQYAALAAFEDDKFTENMRAELDENRKFLMEWLDEREIEYVYPQGAFYVFAKYANLRIYESLPACPRRRAQAGESTRISTTTPPCKGGGSIKFALRLLDLGVAVTPGIAFGDYDDYIRISYSVEREKLEEALEKIAKNNF
ncbi:MAG: pyridoxal phosphate-dependent aminotransferase [bacterium]